MFASASHIPAAQLDTYGPVDADDEPAELVFPHPPSTAAARTAMHTPISQRRRRTSINSASAGRSDTVCQAIGGEDPQHLSGAAAIRDIRNRILNLIRVSSHRSGDRSAAPAILLVMASADHLIRPPLQRRSRESLERLLQTGLELLQERGFDGFTLQELSQRAGVSIGSIYARVEGREALIMAIYERAMQSIDAEERAKLQQVQSLEGLAPRERVARLITTAAETMLANGDVLGVFMRQAPMNSEILSRGAEISRANARVFARALLAHREEMRHPDPELAVDVAWRMIYCTIARRITHGPRFESTRPLSDERLVREVTRAALDYLF